MAVRTSIRQPLASDALDRERGAGRIVIAKRDSVVIPKIEFAEISLQMGRADVVIDAINTALEDRKITLNRVGIGIASHILY